MRNRKRNRKRCKNSYFDPFWGVMADCFSAPCFQRILVVKFRLVLADQMIEKKMCAHTNIDYLLFMSLHKITIRCSQICEGRLFLHKSEGEKDHFFIRQKSFFFSLSFRLTHVEEWPRILKLLKGSSNIILPVISQNLWDMAY